MVPGFIHGNLASYCKLLCGCETSDKAPLAGTMSNVDWSSFATMDSLIQPLTLQIQQSSMRCLS